VKFLGEIKTKQSIYKMSYSALLGGTEKIRCKATDGDFASGLKITDTAGQSQNFVQTPLNDLILEQRDPAGVLQSSVNLTTLSESGIPSFGGVDINDPTLTGQVALTADAGGEFYITASAPAPPSALGAGTVSHGKLNLNDPTGAGRVVLAVDALGDLTFTPDLPAPAPAVSLSALAANAIGVNPLFPAGALIATGVLVLNGGAGAQSIAVADITATSTVAVAVSQHLSPANTANYAVGAITPAVGFDITSMGATDLDEVRWFVYNT
jgi:hypothetical protein